MVDYRQFLRSSFSLEGFKNPTEPGDVNFWERHIEKFPAEVLFAQNLFKVLQMCSDIRLDGNFVELHFSPRLNRDGLQALKSIGGGFSSEQSVDGKTVLFQTLLDENAFNTVL